MGSHLPHSFGVTRTRRTLFSAVVAFVDAYLDWVLRVPYRYQRGPHMKRISGLRPSPATAIAFAALLIALGGTGYAAVVLPANSVGTKQLQNRAVRGSKIKNNTIGASKIQPGSLNSS